MFLYIDINGDKKFFKKEVLEYMKVQVEVYGMLIYDKKWRKYYKIVVVNIFEYEDIDEDGFIFYEEFSGFKMMYYDEFQIEFFIKSLVFEGENMCDSFVWLWVFYL